MRRVLLAVATLVLGLASASAQSLDDLNIQIHGYAAQGFVYTTHNNVFTMNSSDGSPAWSEPVVNIGSQPSERLHIGFQARYFLLGNFGNTVGIDWAAVDYRASDKLGIRFGKTKTPMGLFNETQDIDPSWHYTG